MKKNKRISFLIICIISTMLIGCSKKEAEVVAVVETEEENMFGLTESEQKMYAEYAAGAFVPQTLPYPEQPPAQKHHILPLHCQV